MTFVLLFFGTLIVIGLTLDAVAYWTTRRPAKDSVAEFGQFLDALGQACQ